MADNPGNGYSSPFGNGNGNTSGPSVGGNDFTKNPQGTSNPGKGEQLQFVTLQRKQQTGPIVGVGGANPDSIPPGGRLLTADPKNADNKTIAGTKQRLPFRLEGPKAPEAPPPQGPSESSDSGSMSAGEIPGSLEGLDPFPIAQNAT